MQWNVFSYQKMENYTFQWFMYLFLCINTMMYIFMYTHLVIYGFGIFHHSDNFLLTNAFIYLYLMRLSLDKRPLQFLKHMYLLNETIFQEKKQWNYVVCDHYYATSTIFILILNWLNTHKVFHDWQKAFRENTEIIFLREWIQPHHVYCPNNVYILCNSKWLQRLWLDKRILMSLCPVPWRFFIFDCLTCMYLFMRIHLKISM